MLLTNQLKNKNLFSTSEESIVQYINDHPKEAVAMNIIELAAAAYSSPSTIVRMCKKLGMSGFSEFKLKLASEINSFILNEKRIELDVPLEKGMDQRQVAQAFINLHFQALTDTFNALDYEKLTQAARMMMAADSVSFFGKGPSLLIAEDFQYKLLRLGFSSVCEALEGFQGASVRPNKLKRVAVFISHYANSIDVQERMNELRHYKIPIILICANSYSPYQKLANLCINIDNEESRIKLGSFSSRTSMQLVCDILYGLIFESNYEKNLASLVEYETYRNSIRSQSK